MYIASIQVNNYKSYRASSKLALKPGINIITGQNNAGKTALIEAIGLIIGNVPHRSIATIPKAGMAPQPTSAIEAMLILERQELFDFVLARASHLNIYLPAEGTNFGGTSPFAFTQSNSKSHTNLLNWALKRDDFEINYLSSITPETAVPMLGSYAIYRAKNQLYIDTFLCHPDGSYRHSEIRTADSGQTLGQLVVSYFKRNRYVFRAERFNLGTCAVGPNSVLAPDASNLAEVLSNLSRNPSRLKRFNETVHRVLPQIKQITVLNLLDNKLEIYVWLDHPDPAHDERDDLAVSLNQSGTGVGQVLAILYVVLNAEQPRTILIDEPQSFLHPGAVRKLIEVLKENPRHQHILTTHSPTVIAASNPSTITLIKHQGGESNFQTIDPTENEQLKHYLFEIGARLSDAFGADNILWVEGPTEEICFPKILEKVAQRSLMGTAIMAVKHTGDLEGKHAKTVFDIYDKLSTGKGLLPPAIGFIFDKEGRTQQVQDDIRGKSNNRVTFLPRRLYENYLLNPTALAAIINGISGFRETPVTEVEITTWISNQVQAWVAGNKTEGKYGPAPEDPDKWQTLIHGAHLLESLFKNLSEQRVVYDKISYSVSLTEWLIEHAPEDLREIADLMQNMIKSGD